MSPRKRRYLKNTVFTLVLLAALAWVVPFFLNAGRYRPLLKAAIERSLHRKVTLGHIDLHFFPHLGFTVDNVVVDEDPAFGLEPFIRVNSIDCNLLWRSLWHSHLYFGTLRLKNPSINIVRNSAGNWNIENLLLQSGVTQTSPGRASSVPPPTNLSVEIRDARLNFKVGENKKPFAIVGTNAHLDFDYGSDRVSFRIAGDPVRTDLEFPTPGLVALDGAWSPAVTRGGALNATLRMQGALLYDWIPLLTGKNPEVYGVMNSTIHMSGTLRKIDFSGNSRLSQLHRWEQLPSSNDMPCGVRFRGQFDRDKMSLLINGMDLDFANSQVHLEGSITRVASRPDFDLVVAFERSQVQDLMRLDARVFGNQLGWGLKGRVNGMIAIRGPWGGQHYGGFLNAHEVLLETSSGTFPVSSLAIRIARSGARLAPARVRLAPGVEVVAEGTLQHISPGQKRRRSSAHPTYELTLYSHAVNLGSLVHFGRALGFLGDNHLEAEGIGSFTLHLAGRAWPWGRPSVTAQASVRSARLVIPGLREPLNIPRARIQVYGKQIIVNPVLAVMGTSVFSGWVMHQSGSQAPWDFSLQADKVSIEQVSQWFNGIGDQHSGSFFDKLSGIGSLINGPPPSFHLAGRLNARGHFATPLLSYRALALHDFQANVQIHDRKIRLAKVGFEAGGGRGEGNAVVDLTGAAAQISGHAGVSGASVEALRAYLPPALTGAQGYYSAAGSFEARGLTHAEIVRTFRGRATVQLESVKLGNFDPVRIMARRFGMDLSETSSQPLFITSATAQLDIQDRRVVLEDFPVDISGAEFGLKGAYAFDGVATLQVQADLRGVHRPWVAIHPRTAGPVSRLADLRFAGTLRNLELVPSAQISQTQP
jgi:AsmA family/AsmA-like C-terminal region